MANPHDHAHDHRHDDHVARPRSAADLPTEAVALALGMCVSRPEQAAPGAVATLVSELERRRAYGPLMASLDPSLARSIHLLYVTDKGRIRYPSRQPRPSSTETPVTSANGDLDFSRRSRV